MIVKVCKLSEIEVAGKLVKVGVETIEPKLPTYGKEGDACMDIYPIHCEYDIERDRWIYHTGLAFAIGDSLTRSKVSDKKDVTIVDVNIPNEMEIRPRSNLTKSDFYMPNSPGTLDTGYRGELLVVFKNRTSNFLIQAVNEIIMGVERLAMRSGHNGEIKQFTSSARRRLTHVLDATNKPPYKCDGQDRCCQILVRGSQRIVFQEVKTVEELGSSERGAGGFGSTGGAVK